MSWFSLFPHEMELGDSLGEMGRITRLERNLTTLTWRFELCAHEPTHRQHEVCAPVVIQSWPENAPRRVLRDRLPIDDDLHLYRSS